MIEFKEKTERERERRKEYRKFIQCRNHPEQTMIIENSSIDIKFD
jgi:hypothetical protein